jgi:hypothetical protein
MKTIIKVNDSIPKVKPKVKLTPSEKRKAGAAELLINKRKQAVAKNGSKIKKP